MARESGPLAHGGDRINQKVALKMLEKLGYRADLAANGLEVLEALDRQRYDLILMDVSMPEMDGLQASREILRRYLTELRPCILAMTANATVADRDECLEAGMDGFLSKPVKPEELAEAIESCPPARGGAASERPAGPG